MQTKEAVTEKGKIAEVCPKEPHSPQTEREKLKQMSGKARAAYIWGYYKMYFIAGLILIVIGANLLNTLVLNPPPKTYLSVATYGTFASLDDIGALAEDMTAKMIDDPSEFVIGAEVYHISAEAVEMSATMTQKLMANISAGEVDLIIADQENFDFLLDRGLYMPLGEIFDREMLDQYARDIYRAAPVLYDENMEQVDTPEDEYGFRLDENAYFEALGIDAEGMIIGVVPTVGGPNAAAEGLRLMLGES